MKLSTLQKYILLKCLEKGNKVDRKIFRKFYPSPSSSDDSSGGLRRTSYYPLKGNNYRESIITRSIEHLIDREFMTGFGRRTPHKWFITHVSLTKKGAKISQDLLNERQEKLPLK